MRPVKHDLLAIKTFCQTRLVIKIDIHLGGKNFDNFPELDCDTKIRFSILIGLVCKLVGVMKIDFMLEAFL